MIGTEVIAMLFLFGGLTMIRIFAQEHNRWNTIFNQWNDMKKIKDVINNNAPESKYIKNDDECTICIEPLRDKTVRTLHCKHIFHKHCIDKWIFSNHNSCPNCNADIIHHNDDDSEEYDSSDV